MFRANPWVDHRRNETQPRAMETNDNAEYATTPLSVKEERKCLQEIRAVGRAMTSAHVLSNGMRATDFALQFILNHQLKRKSKCGT